MALGASIMNLFSGGKSPVGNAADVATAQTQVASAAANPTVPSPSTPTSTGSLPAIPAAGTGTGSPLDNFKDLWKTDPNANQQTPSLVPSFNLDPAKLRDASKQLNFTSALDPALVQKAMSGDSAAFMDVLNQTAQLGFANATAASGELIKQSLSTAQGTLQDQIVPAAIRNANISQEMAANNPVFADPSVAPMLSMLQKQFATKYPTATPQEIAGLAKDYLGGIAGKIVTGNGGTVVSANQQTQRNAMSAPEQDWGKFFDA